MKKQVVLRVIPFPFDIPTTLIAIIVDEEPYRVGDHFLERHTDGKDHIYKADNENDLGHPGKRIIAHTSDISLLTLQQISRGELSDGDPVYVEIDLVSATADQPAPLKYDEEGKIILTMLPKTEAVPSVH